MTGAVQEVWQFLFPPNWEAREEAFRSTLEESLHLGAKIGGLLAILGTVGDALIRCLLAGGQMQWAPAAPLGPHDVLFLNKSLSVVAGSLGVETGRREVSLCRGRIISAALGIVVGGATLYSDALRGTFHLAYLTVTLAVMAVLIGLSAVNEQKRAVCRSVRPLEAA
jgi:hypothetical protein